MKQTHVSEQPGKNISEPSDNISQNVLRVGCLL
eukprot:COSAG06_NODE_10427_length_1683_cov_1.270833_1_plen_32_part_10